MLWLLDNQGGRRNLADIDKISIARKKEVILAAQAKGRMSAGGGDQVSAGAGLSKSTNPVEPIHTRKEAAKEAGVGQTKYDEGKVILDAVASGEAPKKLLEQVRAGEVSVHKAAIRKAKRQNRVYVEIDRPDRTNPHPSGFCSVGFNRTKQNRPPPFDRGRSNGRQHNTK